MKKLSISVLLLFVFFSGTVLVGQTGPSDTGSDPSHQALSWMVDEVAGMLVRELGGDGPAADIHVRGITMQDTPVLLGDYLAASLPVRMSRRSGHSISVYSRPGAGFYSISGKVFRIGDALDLFITLHDQDGRVVTGKELRLPLSPGLEELLVPANYGGGGDLYEPDSGSSPLVFRMTGPWIRKGTGTGLPSPCLKTQSLQFSLSRAPEISIPISKSTETET